MIVIAIVIVCSIVIILGVASVVIAVVVINAIISGIGIRINIFRIAADDVTVGTLNYYIHAVTRSTHTLGKQRIARGRGGETVRRIMGMILLRCTRNVAVGPTAASEIAQNVPVQTYT